MSYFIDSYLISWQSKEKYGA